jgi:tRNA1(Val) A37 N6-methylase TrmN6
LRELPHSEEYDIVTANPPYYKHNSGAVRTAEQVARSEVACTLSDVAGCAKRLLKYGGVVKFCLPLTRLAEACTVFSGQGLEPKVIKIIGERLFLMECKKGGKPGVIVKH